MSTDVSEDVSCGGGLQAGHLRGREGGAFTLEGVAAQGLPSAWWGAGLRLNWWWVFFGHRASCAWRRDEMKRPCHEGQGCRGGVFG